MAVIVGPQGCVAIGGSCSVGAFGCNGVTAQGTEASLAALSVVSGAYGASASGAYLLLVAKVEAIQARLVAVGLLT